MTLKRKLFLSAMLIGMTPLVAVSVFNHTRLSSMQKNVGSVFDRCASAFENTAQSNRENIQEYRNISVSVGKISENFAGLEQKTRSMLENEILALNREIEIHLEMQGKIIADRTEDFIRSSIRSRMQADLLQFTRNEKNKEFQKFLPHFLLTGKSRWKRLQNPFP